MADFAVLCTGESMSQAVADSVQHLHVIAVNQTFELAPRAAALVANDAGWWKANPHALRFAGRKFAVQWTECVETIPREGLIQPGTNSGVIALEVARTLGARRVLLLGADFHGQHYFGCYRGKLKNTTPERRKIHAKQFAMWRDLHPEVEVVNCTPGTQLRCFPCKPLSEVLC